MVWRITVLVLAELKKLLRVLPPNLQLVPGI